MWLCFALGNGLTGTDGTDQVLLWSDETSLVLAFRPVNTVLFSGHFKGLLLLHLASRATRYQVLPFNSGSQELRTIGVGWGERYVGGPAINCSFV